MAKRRGNGEGTIYRADGRWRAVVSLPTGKRKYLSGRTRDETGRKLTALLKNIQDGLPVTADRETINQFAAGWLAVKKQSIKASTWRRYESLLRVNVLPMLGRVQISKVTPAHLQRLYADRMTAGRGPQTITHIHRVVHAMLSDATRWGNVARNVAALVTPPSVPHRDIRAFDADQALRFLGAAMGTKHEALWTVLISTGVRIGEVAALRWSDIDLPDRQPTEERDHKVTASIRVMGTLDRYAGGYSITEPKSPKSRRRISLPAAVETTIRQHRSRQDEIRLGRGESLGPNEFVFVNATGGPLNVTNLARREFKPLLAKAGLPRSFTIHSLRHTALSFALSRGVAPTDVAELAGHSNVAVTLSTYAHALPDAPHRATDAIAEVLALG